MEIMLSKPDNYFRQDNDATPQLLGAYKAECKNVACGVSSILCLCSIKGFEPPSMLIQPEDYAMMILYNPKLRAEIAKASGVTLKDYTPVQEYRAVYPWLVKKLFGKELCTYHWVGEGNLWDFIVNEIKNKNPVVTSGNFKYGGHYVCFVGYDSSKRELIYNDPFPNNYDDKIGYARRIKKTEFNKVFKNRSDYLA